jgi:CheY-like chemotaxis protein
MNKLSTVLLVDDDETSNFLHQRLLHRLNIADQVLVALNGEQALEMLAQRGTLFSPVRPALVLLDLNMPVMGGIEFLDAFQAMPLLQQQAVVIVVLTTSMNPRDLSHVNSLPIAGLISKPLTKEKLSALLEVHFPYLIPVR